jgi:hypothetical protein
MFGQLPKLFDRNFAIGYFLPVAAFVIVGYELLAGFGLTSDLFPLLAQNNALVNTSIIAVASWFLAAFLLVLNRPLYMLKEGYWVPSWIPDQWQGGKRYYSRLKGEEERLKGEEEDLAMKVDEEKLRLEEQDEQGSDYLTELRIRRSEAARKLGEEFPDEDFLLPTRFGNIIRSFESYSRLVYGLEDIEGWSRLIAVIPKDYRDLIDGAKAQVDFWLNLWFLSLLITTEYVVVVVGLTLWGDSRQGLVELVWSWTLLYLVASIILAIFSSWQSGRAAVIWGDYVKASYDVFVPELGRKLGFPSVTREEQIPLWVLFSQVIIYRRSKHIGKLLGRLSEAPVEDSAGDDSAAAALQSLAVTIQRLADTIATEHPQGTGLIAQPPSSTAAENARQNEPKSLARDQAHKSDEHLSVRGWNHKQGRRLRGLLRRLLKR